MLLLLSLVFFVSGVAALIFETLWFHQAGLGFGSSVWASSLVLSSFMAGLGLGNGLVARLGPRIRRPVRLYAHLEVIIGVVGFLVVLLLPGVGVLLAPALRPLADELWLLNGVRLALGFLILLLPATAMGATLPLLLKALRAGDDNFGAVLGRLYGWNTLGAVAGAVVGELFLVELLGIRGTAAVAIGLDLVAALAAYALAPTLDARVAGEGPAPTPTAAPVTPGMGVRTPALLGAAFTAGFALLALEVVWFRFLQFFVVPTSLAFALMLAVVLAGIGIGGFAGGLWQRLDRRAHRHAPGIAFLAGVAAVVVYADFMRVVEPFAGERVMDAADILRVSIPLMLPVAVLSGVLFTFTGTALAERVVPGVRAAGWLTLANTVGAGLGALVAGMWVLPLLGLESTLFALAALYGMTGILLLATGRQPLSRAWFRYACAVGLVASLVLFPFGDLIERYVAHACRPFGYPQRAEVAALREGRTETVIYLRGNLLGEPSYHHLFTGGFMMASTRVVARRYMKLYVYWPAALQEKLESALLISYGVGNTARALVDTRSIERIDVVDISRDVLELGKIAYPGDSWPLADPRVRTHIEDGRYFLQTTDRRYDLITSEPPPPQHAGAVNLYTREYFELIRDRLNEGGTTTYWLPVHSLTESDTRAIVRAFCDAFDDCTLWSGWEYNWMLVGSRNGRWHRDPERFAAQWSDPIVGPELAALALEVPAQIGSLFMADAPDLEAYTEDIEPLTDDFPKRLEDARYVGPEEKLAAYGRWIDISGTERRFLDSGFVKEAFPPEYIGAALPYFRSQEALNVFVGQLTDEPPDAGRFWESLHQTMRDGLSTLLLWQIGVSGDQIDAMERLLARGESEEPHAMRLGALALADRDFDRAARYFGRARQRRPALVYFQVYALASAGRHDEAIRIARSAAGQMSFGAADRGYWELLAREFGIELFGARAMES